MKKLLQNTFMISLIFLMALSPILSYAAPTEDVNLVEDFANDAHLPHNFRMSTDKVDIANNSGLNLSGLDKLNISGSSQFSEKGLTFMKDAIGDKYPIVDIDLRQESHGYINGIAVSWRNANNSANKGLSLSEVLKDENEKLKSITLNHPITFFNTKNVVVPKVVEDELTLTKSQELGYVRIPVTDGGLPSEEMVNYFLETIKNHPENTWYHFHCEAGVGRTTTFMIMYDTIKNCNNVSLNDIITRQLLLGKLSEKDSAAFYKGNRFTLLNDFYNRCKDNKLTTSLETLYSNTINNNDSYIKNSIVPKMLYVISSSDMTSQEQTMIATLQGIVSTKSDSQIYILSNDEPDYEVWLKDLKSNYNVKYRIMKDPWILLDKFKSYTKGYVLYSALNSPSINNACSLASLNDSLAIDESLEEKVKTIGINNLIRDCRDTDKFWAFDNLWDKGLNHTTIIQLSPDKPLALRDYAIMSKSLMFYEDKINDFTLRENIFSSLDDTSRCLGWGPDEHTNVNLASQYGVDVIASDWSYNLSILSSFDSKKQIQKTKQEVPNEDGVHYVTFIMSDGDNQQWLLGSNYSSKNWYGSPNRGKFNLGWSLSPSLYYLAPTVFNEYYKSASSNTYVDDYVIPPSGNGYMYPSKYPLKKLDSYTKRLSEYMDKVDQHNVLILDDEALYQKDLWDKYTVHSNIDGLFYLNYNKNNSYEGRIVWSNNKPVVSCRDLLWGGLEDGNQVVSNINDRVTKGYTNIKSSDSYTFVYVHDWSNTLDNVQDVISKLNNNTKVRVVTPDVFMSLIKENVLPS